MVEWTKKQICGEVKRQSRVDPNGIDELRVALSHQPSGWSSFMVFYGVSTAFGCWRTNKKVVSVTEKANGVIQR